MALSPEELVIKLLLSTSSYHEVGLVHGFGVLYTEKQWQHCACS